MFTGIFRTFSGMHFSKESMTYRKYPLKSPYFLRYLCPSSGQNVVLHGEAGDH